MNARKRQGFQRGVDRSDAFERANIQYLIEKRSAEMQKLRDTSNACRPEGQRKKVAHYSYPCLVTFRFSDRQMANIACFCLRNQLVFNTFSSANGQNTPPEGLFQPGEHPVSGSGTARITM